MMKPGAQRGDVMSANPAAKQTMLKVPMRAMVFAVLASLITETPITQLSSRSTDPEAISRDVIISPPSRGSMYFAIIGNF
jgi:hypothetical protein